MGRGREGPEEIRKNAVQNRRLPLLLHVQNRCPLPLFPPSPLIMNSPLPPQKIKDWFVNLNLMNSFPYLCRLINTFITIKNMLCVHSYQEITPVGGNGTTLGGNGTTCPVATKIKFYILWWKSNMIYFYSRLWGSYVCCS